MQLARESNNLNMHVQTLESFPPEVVSKLQYYVYRLIDPRNGETFYIGKGKGKGKGNRVFAHVQGSVEDDAVSEKLERIRAIHLAGELAP